MQQRRLLRTLGRYLSKDCFLQIDRVDWAKDIASFNVLVSVSRKLDNERYVFKIHETQWDRIGTGIWEPTPEQIAILVLFLQG